MDPTKAPLSQAPSGRRYFQRRRKRKSATEFNATESPSSPATESYADDVTPVSLSVNRMRDEDPRPRQRSISHGVYVGEVPVLRTGRSAGAARTAKLTVERNLHGVTKRSRSITPKELLGKRLVQRRLRRAVSFGAVEHMLRTMRRSGSQMIWDTQAHRKRRRAHTCSGGLVSQSSLDAVQQDPKHASPKHQEVTAATVIVLY